MLTTGILQHCSNQRLRSQLVRLHIISSANSCDTNFPCFCTKTLWVILSVPVFGGLASSVHHQWSVGNGGVWSKGEGIWAGGRPAWIKLWRGDFSHRAAVALIYSTYDRCFCLEMHHCSGSIRVLQSKVNLTRVHLSSPPNFQLVFSLLMSHCCFTCI